MPKSPPPFLNSRYSDVSIKWMSRLNTWMYRRNNGEGLGGTFQNIPVALLTTTGRKTGRAAGQPAVLPARRRPRHRRGLAGRQQQEPDVVPQPQGQSRRCRCRSRTRCWN